MSSKTNISQSNDKEDADFYTQAERFHRMMEMQRRHVYKLKYKNNAPLIQMEVNAHEQTCQEYSLDILTYLMKQDTMFAATTSFSTPSLDNNGNNIGVTIKKKKKIELSHEFIQLRKLVLDFVMCCHTRLILSTPTLILAFNIIDRFTAFNNNTKTLGSTNNGKKLDKRRFQLIGIIALWIASKYLDKKYRSLNMKTMHHLTGKVFSNKMFIDMEIEILKCLKWNISNIPTHDYFIDILLRTNMDNGTSNDADTGSSSGVNFQFLNNCKYGSQMLCELACFHPELIFNYSISSIAYSAVALTSISLNYYTYNSFNIPNIEYYKIDDIALKLIDIFLTSDEADQDDGEGGLPYSFKLKYFPEDKSQTPIFLLALFSYIQSYKSCYNVKAAAVAATNTPSTTSTNTPSHNTDSSDSNITTDAVSGSTIIKNTKSVITHAPPTPCTPIDILENNGKKGMDNRRKDQLGIRKRSRYQYEDNAGNDADKEEHSNDINNETTIKAVYNSNKVRRQLFNVLHNGLHNKEDISSNDTSV
ncbi:uncharacterized protein SCODWIG_01644 [Saccharomycodes ludwigii]|uniref:Cyclin-like domain-containing protein n=1 Tax=Saccharomycodes ludwigii TaxID=36035 RepID=A0A376B5E8_9ASCO|nr:hypothetical protein SCDLUD_003361 [Saccharomycodes ludwigii]KAH3900384.1 hypothetical protein SCDLUD_003361 [Saccharomycodes ludwigii]SSD59883.1 uncharacterized protein SCODWIG_01644 [Saccharomycodes ludwigii]